MAFPTDWTMRCSLPLQWAGAKPKPDGDRRGEEGLGDGCVQLKPEVSERVRVSSFWRKVVRPLSNRHGHHCDVCPSPIEVVGDDGSQEFE